MKATLKQYRQSPRKVRLVADLIRGKKVDKALTDLEFATKRASDAMKKLLNTAVAGAKHDFNIEKGNLFVKEITVDKGPTLHRRIARARGRATPINKRTSHITVVLAEQEKSEKESSKPETKVNKKTKN
jgi:large subunit ribosomal protein L22